VEFVFTARQLDDYNLTYPHAAPPASHACHASLSPATKEGLGLVLEPVHPVESAQYKGIPEIEPLATVGTLEPGAPALRSWATNRRRCSHG